MGSQCLSKNCDCHGCRVREQQEEGWCYEMVGAMFMLNSYLGCFPILRVNTADDERGLSLLVTGPH